MGILAYGLMILAVLGALAGLYGKIHHDGYAQGRDEMQVRWNKQAEKNRALVIADRTRQEALRTERDKQATRRLANEKKRTDALMGSLEAHIRASGRAAQCPIPDSLRDDWNRANAGPKGDGPGTVPPKPGVTAPPR